jgi:dTDP-4-dehydrorhamnose 3,5-epimerase
MEITESQLEGVFIIKPFTIFEDFRGTYVELYNEELYKEKIPVDFIQDDISTSYQNVLRGIHGDTTTWKLVSCLYGSFYLVIVNNKPDSKQYKQWTSITLLIPPGFGNGHLVLTEQTIFHYKQNTYYDRSTQFTIAWNDPNLNIYWPIKDPILSERDK